DGTVGDQLVDLGGGQPGQHLALLVHQAGDVGQQHQLLGAQRLGHLAGHQVGVDVVGGAVRAHADRRDHRNEVALHQHVQQVGIHADHLADLADVDDFRLGHFRGLPGHGQLAGADQLGVLAGQADGLAAVLVDQIDDALVDLTTEDHLHHVHGRGVGDPHAIDEAALDAQALEQVADLRTAAVHDHRVDADRLHQHDVAGEASLELLALHGIAAVLDHQGLAHETTDVGQGLGKDPGYLGGIVTVGHFLSGAPYFRTAG